MRAYLILTLKWAITLILSYALYEHIHIYAAIALVWCMAWNEAYAGLLGRLIAL